jgi:ferredoxin-like protein FixX
MGMFISISVKNRNFLKSETARQLIEACSVDIFERRNGGVAINTEQEDECILCGRCLEIAKNNLEIVKLYAPGGNPVRSTPDSSG